MTRPRPNPERRDVRRTTARALTRLPSCEEMFLRGPVGHYATSESLLMWCTRPDLCGLVLWGRPTAGEIALLAHIFDHGENTGIATPCDFVLDARRLRSVGVEVLEAFVAHAQPRIRELQRRLRRQAFVRPPGLVGAVVCGLYGLLGARFEWRSFDDPTTALAWVDEPDAARLADQVAQLADTAADASLVARLRAWFDTTDRVPFRIEDAARALGLSTRSLQRRLGDAGRSFRAEANDALMARASSLLVETDLKVGAIGRELGFSSEANFVASFRRRTGLPPAEWRRTRRGER